MGEASGTGVGTRADIHRDQYQHMYRIICKHRLVMEKYNKALTWTRNDPLRIRICTAERTNKRFSYSPFDNILRSTSSNPKHVGNISIEIQ